MAIELDENGDLLPEYDLDYSKANPNRFAARHNQMSVHIGIAPDVADEFSTEESVNDALREYLRITRGENPEIRPR